MHENATDKWFVAYDQDVILEDRCLGEMNVLPVEFREDTKRRSVPLPSFRILPMTSPAIHMLSSSAAAQTLEGTPKMLTESLNQGMERSQTVFH